jgi:cytoskeletal protein CcmA (bactofilin family)
MNKKETSINFLGKGSAWEGKLKYSGSIMIDGHFKGEVISDGNLIVGQDGLIEGDIHVSFVDISGEIHGNIVSDQRVDIHAPGKVFGNIQAPTVVIDEGVIFEGETRMYRAKGAARDQSVLVDSEDYSEGPPPTITAIHGIVKDEATGQPIKNAVVRCKGMESKKINTNASGYYELINLKDGRWKLGIRAKGYRKGKARIDIDGIGSYEQNFELKPNRTK